MRARPAVLLVLAAIMASLFLTSPVALAADSITLAQSSEEQGPGDEGGEGGTDPDEGSGSAEAEVGANQGQTEDAIEETGPPWTYQMARMIVAMLLLIALAIGLMYWRLVVQRQRNGI